MPDQPTPAHDLASVQRKVKAGFVHYRPQAIDDAAGLGFDWQDINVCVLALQPSDFHKSMPAHTPKWQGCMQDVYRPVYCGIWLYVKFQLFPLAAARPYIVSFKKKDSEDDYVD
jgi:hypothetical protein